MSSKTKASFCCRNVGILSVSSSSRTHCASNPQCAIMVVAPVTPQRRPSCGIAPVLRHHGLVPNKRQSSPLRFPKLDAEDVLLQLGCAGAAGFGGHGQAELLQETDAPLEVGCAGAAGDGGDGCADLSQVAEVACVWCGGGYASSLALAPIPDLPSPVQTRSPKRRLLRAHSSLDDRCAMIKDMGLL